MYSCGLVGKFNECTCTCASTCGGGQRWMLQMSLSTALCQVFRQGFPLNMDVIDSARMAGSELQCSGCHLLISTGVTGTQTDFSFYVGTEDLCKSHFTH